MINIYHHQFKRPFSENTWNSYLAEMPLDIQNRISRYFKEENKYQLLIGRLLLKQGMQTLGYTHFKLDDLFYDEFNCPHWKKDIQFNIAHSGNIVACAFSRVAKIGLDLEKIRPIELNDFGHILNDLDYQALKKVINIHLAFFKIWTIKEAVTKAIGKGLAIDVKEIEIFKNHAVYEKKKWYYRQIVLGENYAGHIVSNQPILNLELRERKL